MATGSGSWPKRSSLTDLEHDSSTRADAPVLPTHRNGDDFKFVEEPEVEVQAEPSMPPSVFADKPAMPSAVHAQVTTPVMQPETVAQPVVTYEPTHTTGYLDRQQQPQPTQTVPIHRQFNKNISFVKPQKKRKLRNRFTVWLFVFSLLFFFAGVGLWGQSQLYSDGELGAEVTITVPPGATGTDVAQLLEDSGVLPSATGFEWYLKVRHRGESIQAGDYVVAQNNNAPQVAELLLSEPNGNAAVLLPEGLWVSETLERIAADVDGLTAADLAAELSIRTPPLSPAEGVICSESQPLCIWEGFLFPDTYSISAEATATEVIDTLLASFDQKMIETALVARSQALGYSPYEVLTVASLIESEAAIDADRAKISEVIWHRYSGAEPDNAWLGIDATVIYSLASRSPGDEVVFERHQDGTDPYNTSALGGAETKARLPQTPIGNPGIESIEAALSPTSEGYKWYTLPDPETSAHTFSKTKEEHDLADAAYDERVTELAAS